MAVALQKCRRIVIRIVIYVFVFVFVVGDTRQEGLLAAFPKLMGSGKQHTFVETENVRYVYQPVESLYLLLITNKGSNIVEDLDTLQLLSKLIPEYCAQISERGVADAAFELVFAFDEVIQSGHKVNITLQGIRTNLEMESHEEKLHQMIRASKENEAREEMRRKARALKEAARERSRLERAGFGPSAATGFGNTPSISSGMSMGGSGAGDAPEAMDNTRGHGSAGGAPARRESPKNIRKPRGACDRAFSGRNLARACFCARTRAASPPDYPASWLTRIPYLIVDCVCA